MIRSLYRLTHGLWRRDRERRWRRHLERQGILSGGAIQFHGNPPACVNHGRCEFGAQCCFKSFRIPHNLTVQRGGELIVGDRCFFNDGVNICASLSIHIGDDCKIGDMACIFDTDFHQVTPDAPARRAPVRIGDNVWVAANAMILAGVTIGDHAVVGAGAIVTHDVPARAVVAGVPARVVSTFDAHQGWIRT